MIGKALIQKPRLVIFDEPTRGVDVGAIADMLGQKTVEMARHYSGRADKRVKLTAVITNFDAEMVKRRTKVV